MERWRVGTRATKPCGLRCLSSEGGLAMKPPFPTAATRAVCSACIPNWFQSSAALERLQLRAGSPAPVHRHVSILNRSLECCNPTGSRHVMDTALFQSSAASSDGCNSLEKIAGLQGVTFQCSAAIPDGCNAWVTYYRSEMQRVQSSVATSDSCNRGSFSSVSSQISFQSSAAIADGCNDIPKHSVSHDLQLVHCRFDFQGTQSGTVLRCLREPHWVLPSTARPR